jgi:uncharacterized protein DUF4399
MMGHNQPVVSWAQVKDMLTRILVSGLTLLAIVAPAHAQTPRTPSPPGAEVYFVDLKDGARVPTRFRVNFGLRNMGVAPAGSDRPNAGHHHLLIDTPLPAFDREIPNDFNHLHFGAGQTEAEITLPPGEHTLQLLVGDRDHVPHNPPVLSAPIKVVVVDEARPAQAAQPPAPQPAAAPVRPRPAQKAERPRKEKKKETRKREQRQDKREQAQPREGALERTRRNLGGCVVDLGNGRTEPCR